MKEVLTTTPACFYLTIMGLIFFALIAIKIVVKIFKITPPKSDKTRPKRDCMMEALAEQRTDIMEESRPITKFSDRM